MKLPLVTLGMALGDADHGVHEVGGENRGERVARYLANSDPPINVAAPWCAAWVQERADVAAAHLGLVNPLDMVRREALVADYFAWAKETRRVVPVEQAEPGDLICFNFRGQGWDHIGFVVRRGPAGSIYTVEGNTSPGVGSANVEREREGDGVFTKTRSTTRQPVAIIRWAA